MRKDGGYDERCMGGGTCNSIRVCVCAELRDRVRSRIPNRRVFVAGEFGDAAAGAFGFETGPETIAFTL
jgi:hypothetical protein